MLHELLAHADAVVPAGEAVAVAGQAFELHVDVSALAGILDGVGDDVENDLFQPSPVAEDHAVCAVAVDGELLLLLAREGVENVRAPIQAVWGAEGLVQKLNRTVLELVDVQNRVDEHKQIVALGRDVAERVFELVVIVFILARDLRHAEHDVERRADIVAHLGEEVLLGLGGLLSLFVERRGKLVCNLLLAVAALDRLDVEQEQQQDQKTVPRTAR